MEGDWPGAFYWAESARIGSRDEKQVENDLSINCSKESGSGSSLQTVMSVVGWTAGREPVLEESDRHAVESLEASKADVRICLSSDQQLSDDLHLKLQFSPAGKASVCGGTTSGREAILTIEDARLSSLQFDAQHQYHIAFALKTSIKHILRADSAQKLLAKGFDLSLNCSMKESSWNQVKERFVRSDDTDCIKNFIQNFLPVKRCKIKTNLRPNRLHLLIKSLTGQDEQLLQAVKGLPQKFIVNSLRLYGVEVTQEFCVAAQGSQVSSLMITSKIGNAYEIVKIKGDLSLLFEHLAAKLPTGIVQVPKPLQTAVQASKPVKIESRKG